MLSAALESQETLYRYVDELVHTLRVVLFLTGSATIAALRRGERAITGETAAWNKALGGVEETRAP